MRIPDIKTIYKLSAVAGMLFFASCGYDVPKEVSVAYDDLPEEVDFNFHIKPILSDRCFNCHGPDANTRKAGLRLDLKDEMFKKLESGNRAFVSGNPGNSEVISRILTEDKEMMMPPESSHLKLSAREKALILKWVEQGAEWKKHWAYIPPEKTKIPDFSSESPNIENEIDNFVYDKLKSKGFKFSPEADKEQLLRRLAIDLTGLPPTLEELDQFLNDDSPQAYEKMVDKYLSSDANAERLTLDWLDLSRYADSHGIHADGWRNMWPWRDWVIKAFKNNMPYDEFVTWQLAGDLLPNPDREKILATAFNRNTPMTGEGGVIDEEYRLSYVFDRAETTSTAFLGLTVACAKCHDHKFDPISQKDYYEMSAFFNNVKELGMTGDDGNFGPLLQLTTDEEQHKIDSLNEAIKKGSKDLALTKKELMDLETFMNQIPKTHKTEGLVAHLPLEKSVNKGKNNNYYVFDNNKNTYAQKDLESLDGAAGKSVKIDGDFDFIEINDTPNFELTDAFSAALWVNTTKRDEKKTQTLLGTTGDKNNDWRGWEFYLDNKNRLNVRLIHALPSNIIHVQSLDSIKTNNWNHVAFNYSGTADANDVEIFINGEKVKTKVLTNHLYKSIKTIAGVKPDKIVYRPVKIGKSGRNFSGENGLFKGRVDEIYLYERTLSLGEVKLLMKEADSLQNDEPALADETLVKEYWVAKDPAVVKQKKKLKALRSDWLEVMNPVSEIMVMKEMPHKRTSFIYERGEYNQPSDTVYANTLSTLPPFPEDFPKNRLGLSKWLFMDENPLTARVAVNRYWQMVFGKGIVDTPQDFGVQGNLPTHPELLDWLAIYFRENNWDVKALLKKMVMSHTYKQISTPTAEMASVDPENVYLSRANSYRLPAEFIRDNALAASGLLVRTVGGESVKPYMPADLWAEKSSFSHMLLNYKASKGDSLYRRSMYTFIRRTSPHPAMSAFDAPTRDVCTVERENTNTPLQALVLLNDEEFVEASRVLAERVQMEGGDSIDRQITLAFRLATSITPSEGEVELLKELYSRQLAYFEKTPSATNEILRVGAKDFNTALNKEKTAALTMVSSTILNHDEAFMRR
ncbi:DUF1553 domain-containing protein [Galbibacter mesophilus]|uniref:DUF1553 domain-containing protein n=1 Tax=Galbibacter mesophilus TaxID=379069 RepID=UPI001F5E2B50|nr:DUF1553 domain-containing protein [Galbibacter mesophilus]MCM5663391.1 DUF1553 domain-containing protein [Galbibacter mesophilus]